MKKLAVLALSTAALALTLNGGASLASSGSGSSGGGGSTSTASGTWNQTTYPLPLSPGHIISQSSSRASVRSTDTVATVMRKLDYMYVTQRHCTLHVLVNKPADYVCGTHEVYFTFAALDPKPTDASRSQTNAFKVR
ncbi:MAG: hypothetical protein HOQ45_08180 [Nocardioidaceae bacterium]|nr:hypothetical protein [Nocardioidaceae bacterium]